MKLAAGQLARLSLGTAKLRQELLLCSGLPLAELFSSRGSVERRLLGLIPVSPFGLGRRPINGHAAWAEMPPPLLPEALFEEELVGSGEALGGGQVSQVQLPWATLLPEPHGDVSLDGVTRPRLPAEGELKGALVHSASSVAG